MLVLGISLTFGYNISMSTGAAGINEPYIVATADSNLPNSVVLMAVYSSSTPPTNTGTVWNNGGVANIYNPGTGTWIPISGSGATGATGTRGSLWYSGTGAPGTISGQLANDFYLDNSTGNVYELIGSSWAYQLDITGASGSRGSLGMGSVKLHVCG